MANVNQAVEGTKVEVGTIVTITEQGKHYFMIGSDAVILDVNGDGSYNAEGYHTETMKVTQIIHGTDFVVKEQPWREVGQAIPEKETKVGDSMGAGTVVNVTKVDEHIEEGTVVKIVGDSGHHLMMGTTATVIRLDKDGDYYVKGESNIGELEQWLERSDFEVIAATKTEGASDTLTKTTEVQAIKAGDTVTIIGNEPCKMSKLLHDMDRGLHGVPIGTKVEVLEVRDDRVIVDTSGVALEDEYYNEEVQMVPMEFVELANTDDDDFWADMFDFDDEEEEEESEELERLTEDTLKGLRKGDKLVYIGHEDGTTGSDLTLGKTYEVTDDYAKDEGSFTAMLFGGIAKFIDDANDACMLNAINCAAFAKAPAEATVSPTETEEFPRLNAETVQELREGDVIMFVGHPEGEYVEGATEGFKYVLTSDFEDKGDFYSSVVGPHADFLDDDGDESFISKRNCVMFAKFE